MVWCKSISLKSTWNFLSLHSLLVSGGAFHFSCAARRSREGPVSSGVNVEKSRVVVTKAKRYGRFSKFPRVLTIPKACGLNSTPAWWTTIFSPWLDSGDRAHSFVAAVTLKVSQPFSARTSCSSRRRGAAPPGRMRKTLTEQLSCVIFIFLGNLLKIFNSPPWTMSFFALNFVLNLSLNSRWMRLQLLSWSNKEREFKFKYQLL